MPTLKPFKAFLAKPEFIRDVTASSTDFNSEKELSDELRQNQNSYLHMSKNHLIRENLEQSSSEFFKNARVCFDYLVDSEVIAETSGEIFFVYRQTVHGVSHTGIIGLSDIVDYQNDKIKKHEHTKPPVEDFLATYIKATEVIGEPVLLSHHHKQSLEDLLRFVIQGTPSIEFEKFDRQHQIWTISDKDTIESIQSEIAALDELYIMDGHHRAASVSNLYREYKTDAYRYCISFLIDCNQLTINPFHRLVEANRISFEELISALDKKFVLEEIPEYAIRPENPGEFVLRCQQGSYRLISKQSSEQLDVQLFEEIVLRQVFDISDSRVDDRVSFIASEEELNHALTKTVDQMNYLFLLHPCTFEEIARISDRGEFMPPKSTFVEPKCDSGMFIQSFGKRV